MSHDIEHILIDAAAIQARVHQLGLELTRFYKSLHAKEILVICIANGAILFAADLIRAIHLPLKLDCVRMSSYKGTTAAVSDPTALDLIQLDLADQHVLIVDTVLDSGQTFKKILSIIHQKHPLSVHTCAFLDKKINRETRFTTDFIGFKIENEFIVGYGLDFKEHYRNLPFIGTLKSKIEA